MSGPEAATTAGVGPAPGTESQAPARRVRVLPNLLVLTGAAEYGQPWVQRVLDVK